MDPWLWFVIASFLPPKSLLSLGATSKGLQYLSHDDHLWFPHLKDIRPWGWEDPFALAPALSREWRLSASGKCRTRYLKDVKRFLEKFESSPLPDCQLCHASLSGSPTFLTLFPVGRKNTCFTPSSSLHAIWDEGRFYKAAPIITPFPGYSYSSTDTESYSILCQNCMEGKILCTGGCKEQEMTRDIWKMIMETDIACHNPPCKEKKANSTLNGHTVDYKRYAYIN
jgi:hypothetical protein